MFTKEELTNLLAIINRSQITGQEAVIVATLQQKISNLLKDDGKEAGKDRK